MHLIASADHLSSLQCCTPRSAIFCIILASMPGAFSISAFESAMLLLIAFAQSLPSAVFFLQPAEATESAATNINEVFMPHLRNFSNLGQPLGALIHHLH